MRFLCPETRQPPTEDTVRATVAQVPGQVFSWDITKLAGPVKGTYFDGHVMIDIYSRYIVGAVVHAHESGPLASGGDDEGNRPRTTPIGEKLNLFGNGTPIRYMDKPSKDSLPSLCCGALEVEVQEDGPGLRLTRADSRHLDLSGYPVRVNYMATLTHFTSSFH
jgi:hypothetical protein